MRKFIKTCFLLLFSAFLLPVSNPLSAQESDVISRETAKQPLRVRFMVGAGGSWYSLAAKDGWQQKVFSTDYIPFNYSDPSVYQLSHNINQASGFRFADVKPGFKQGLCVGIAIEKQISSKMDLQLVPTLFLSEMTVTYEIDLIDQEGQMYYHHAILSRDLTPSLGIPLLVYYRPFGNSLCLTGGISPMMVFEKEKESELMPRLMRNRFDLSVDIGMEYKFKKRLGIQVKMGFGLINVIKGMEEEYQYFYHRPGFFYLPLQSARTNRLEVLFFF